MTRFLMTVAATALIPAATLAGSHSSGDAEAMDKSEPKMQGDMAEGSNTPGLGVNKSFRISSVMGGTIYTTSATDEVEWDVFETYDSVDQNWTDIGSIDDVVLSQNGKVEGILAEVGGFLGMGDKLVMLPVDQMKMVSVDDGEYAVVTSYTTDRLTDMQSYDSGM